ncbi:MAG: metal ABC transporter ATP-binding protein [Rhodospirillaceae bacterium]|nr:metal ABC transporter ATP-binding protein [Rhodospirillaceae bacterium]
MEQPLPPDTLISLRAICLSREEQSILENVSLDVSRQEILTIVGPNGAGKTSLARVAAGLIRPQSGKILRAPGLKIGYVPQDFPTDPTVPISVRRFLDLPHRLNDTEALTALDLMSAAYLINKPISRISGGERQRVLIAMALASKPDLLILDEPSKGLDPISENDLYARLPDLRDRFGFGVLMISHDLHVVMAATDRVICLNRHVCCQGTPQDVGAIANFQTLFADPESAHLALYHHRPHQHAPHGGDDSNHANVD